MEGSDEEEERDQEVDEDMMHFSQSDADDDSADGDLARALAASRAASRESAASSYSPSSADVSFLAECTGRSMDECLAVLLEKGGNKDAAITVLLASAHSSRSAGSASGAQSSSARPGVTSTRRSYSTLADARALADMTGKSLQECIIALCDHDDTV